VSEILKPCPFCGGQPTWWKTKIKHCQLHGEPYQHDVLGCRKARCIIRPSVCENINAHAIDIWNFRPSEGDDRPIPHSIKYYTVLDGEVEQI
jgi:hypothetical protein